MIAIYRQSVPIRLGLKRVQYKLGTTCENTPYGTK